MRIDVVTAEERDGQRFFEVRLYCLALKPEDIEVQLYANPRHSGEACCWPMSLVAATTEVGDFRVYRGAVSAERAAADYTVRAVPHNAELFLPLEAPEILWQH